MTDTSQTAFSFPRHIDSFFSKLQKEYEEIYYILLENFLIFDFNFHQPILKSAENIIILFITSEYNEIKIECRIEYKIDAKELMTIKKYSFNFVHNGLNIYRYENGHHHHYKHFKLNEGDSHYHIYDGEGLADYNTPKYISLIEFINKSILLSKRKT